MTKRGVSNAVRAEVEARAHGFCELFCELPTPGNQIVHPSGKGHPGHQGMGGAASDADCNQARYVLWGCQVCQDKTHHGYTIARIDLDVGELEIMDSEMRKVPHELIFFHQRHWWLEALAKYPELTTKLERWNRLGYEVAELLGFFAPEKGKPQLWNVCEEFTPNPNLRPRDEFRRFAPCLGMPGSKAVELARIGQWGARDGLGSILAGADLDALDALRSVAAKVDGEEFVELAGMAKADPRGFWDEVDKIRSGKRKRAWVITRDDGSMSPTRSVERPELADDEALIRGTIVVGAGRVQDDPN